MLRLENCTAGYAARPVLAPTTFALERGETLAVVGPSGCGKTTLLYTAAGLISPQGGEILLDGSSVKRGDRRVGLVLQQYGLFPWFTVLDNAALGLRLAGIARAERIAAARAALAAVGVEALADRFPATLSGGEQQRVAIARTWALRPQLLLMDEPFSALDALTRESLQDMLRVLLQTRETASILVTHSIDEAVLLGSRIALMYGSPARLDFFVNPIAENEMAHRRTSSDYRDAVIRVRNLFEERVNG